MKQHYSYWISRLWSFILNFNFITKILWKTTVGYIYCFEIINWNLSNQSVKKSQVEKTLKLKVFSMLERQLAFNEDLESEFVRDHFELSFALKLNYFSRIKKRVKIMGRPSLLPPSLLSFLVDKVISVQPAVDRMVTLHRRETIKEKNQIWNSKWTQRQTVE